MDGKDPLKKQRAKCVKKVRYDTREAAYFFARADGLRAYLCPVCRGWHLTSQRVDSVRSLLPRSER